MTGRSPFDGDLLAERARVTPDKLALVSVESGERLTYAQLDARAEELAVGLRGQGYGEGDRVGLLALNSLDFIAFFFGSGKAGTIVVPLSTRATAHELGPIADDCAMRGLFYGPEHAAIAAEVMAGAKPLESARRPPASSKRAAAARPTAPLGEAVYCLLYTSGTTGKPKGVMIPRRQLWWNGYNTALNWGLREDDITSIYTPLYHAGGLAAFLIPIFCVGGTVVVHKGFQPSEVWRVLQEERCTVALGVPTIWQMLMEAPEFAGADLSHLRWLISGGAPLPQYIIEAYQRRGVPFKQGYGMTEVGVNCFTMTVDDSYRKPGSIGRPMMFTSVRLVDEQGSDVPSGDVGEMWIRGPHVSLGYWQNEAATRAAYTDDGWLKTGDLARRDGDGYFYIAGRRKEMFITGGVNVYPAEIEAELVAHPAVSDAAVVAVPDVQWGEAGIAFVVASGVDAEELTTYLSTRLARYKVPKRFVFVDTLPRTAYGKVVKESLAVQTRAIDLRYRRQRG
jgi:fatty-acyl-CoA synthase